MKIPVTQEIPISEIKINPRNPRIVKDAKFRKLVKSIKDFPAMLYLRPVVLNKDKMILGGDKRYKAAKEAGMKTVPGIICTDLTPEQEDEFVIKDNLHAGDWDMSMLENDWDKGKLGEWGMDGQDKEEDLVFGKNNQPAYPIVAEADEKYDTIIIISKSNTDTIHIKSILGISQEKSYKNEHVGESSVITAEKFIETWNSK